MLFQPIPNQLWQGPGWVRFFFKVLVYYVGSVVYVSACYMCNMCVLLCGVLYFPELSEGTQQSYIRLLATLSRTRKQTNTSCPFCSTYCSFEMIYMLGMYCMFIVLSMIMKLSSTILDKFSCLSTSVSKFYGAYKCSGWKWPIFCESKATTWKDSCVLHAITWYDNVICSCSTWFQHNFISLRTLL